MIGPRPVGRGRAAGLCASLADHHPSACSSQVGGRDEAVVAAADHDRVVDVRARHANLLERRFNPERYLRDDRDTNRSNAPAPESPPDRSTSATGAVRSSGRRMITESPAAIPAIAYIPLAPTTGSTNPAATNETVIPPWHRPSMAPRT